MLNIKNIFPQIFADDTKIVGSSIKKLELILDVCEEWAKENYMSINQKKSKIMFHGNTMSPTK